MTALLLLIDFSFCWERIQVSHERGALFMPLSLCQSTGEVPHSQCPLLGVLAGTAGLWLWSAGPMSFLGTSSTSLRKSRATQDVAVLVHSIFQSSCIK